jgi:hypothetical protein
MDSLAKMKPAFRKEGTVTAGNASGINDGAAFMVLAAADRAAAAGHKPIARIVSYAIAGVPNEIMGEGPIPASKLALKKAGLDLIRWTLLKPMKHSPRRRLPSPKALNSTPPRPTRMAARSPSVIQSVAPVHSSRQKHCMNFNEPEAGTRWSRCASVAVKGSRSFLNAFENYTFYVSGARRR